MDRKYSIGTEDYAENVGRPAGLLEELEQELFFAKKMLHSYYEIALGRVDGAEVDARELFDTMPEVWAAQRRLKDLRTALRALYRAEG
jgi:hypothetical protein